MVNRRTDARVRLEFLNHPPLVPAGCAWFTDQTRCTRAGDVALFNPEFARSTASGDGVEVVLGPRGCVVRRSATRGTELGARQVSLQATGRDARTLMLATERGCLDRRLTLADESGKRVALQQAAFGVSGRYWLTRHGQTVAPVGSGDFFGRNPRTIAGTTRNGKIILVTIDGRQPRSVGTTMDETAAVARSMGM